MHPGAFEWAPDSRQAARSSVPKNHHEPGAPDPDFRTRGICTSLGCLSAIPKHMRVVSSGFFLFKLLPRIIFDPVCQRPIM